MKNIIFFILINHIIFANSISLKEVVDYAMDNNIEMQIEKLNHDNSNTKLKIFYKNILPGFSVVGSSYNRYDRDYPNVDGSWNSNYGVRLSQPIFGGNQIDNLNIEKLNYQNSSINFKEKKDLIRLNIIKSYLNILFYEEKLKLNILSLKELKTQLDKQKILALNKRVAKSEFLKVESNYIEQGIQKMETEDLIKIEILNLEKLSGLKLENYSLIPLDKNIYDIKKLNIETDLAKINNSSDFSKIDNDVKISNIQKSKYLKSILPQVDLSFDYSPNWGEEKKFKDSLKGEYNWKASLEFSFNFNWGKDYNNYEIAQNNFKIANLRRLNTEKNLKISLRTKYLEILRLNKSISAKEKKVLSLKENYKIDKLRYEGGVISTIEFLDSEKNYIEEQINLSDLNKRYFIAFEEYYQILN